MPGEEDFGIVPLEAQACGTPVVALGKGGALETVVDGVTGVLYPEAGPAPLADAIERARAARFDAGALVANAGRFSEPAFRARFLEAARAALLEAGRADLAAGLPATGP
jgi:glycosyltransferase involved in cell wall biosynthesis